MNHFSAIANWHPDNTKVQKHKQYIERLRKENIIPVLGKFKEKDIHCKLCGKNFKSHEEKRTDVNIALKIVSEAVLNN
ncbi:MAG: NYN domain-containing protein, partial [Alphaproteobacteria bacterium]|nr:NYN domain-containing protein [Alphaproteobacteria bacterium]